jgi:hypothetical protein
MNLLDKQANSNDFILKGGHTMEKYQIGDIVYAKLGAFPVVGTIVAVDKKAEKYLVRFSAVQQNWYAEEELIPYQQK